MIKREMPQKNKKEKENMKMRKMKIYNSEKKMRDEINRTTIIFLLCSFFSFGGDFFHEETLVSPRSPKVRLHYSTTTTRFTKLDYDEITESCEMVKVRLVSSCSSGTGCGESNSTSSSNNINSRRNL